LPHSVEGFVIYIGTHRYIVVDECSGLAYVTLAGFLGYCFGLLLYRSLTKVVALALLGALIGIVSNVLRVDAIVFIDWLRDSQMDLAAHGTLQWIALFATLGLLFFVLARLKGDAPSAVAPPVPPPQSAATMRKFAPVFGGLAGLLIAGCATALPAPAMGAQQAAQADEFPNAIAGWQLSGPVPSWSVAADGATESIDLTYMRDGREWHAVIVTTLSPTAKLRASALTPRDGTWREQEIRRERGCAADRCIEFVHSTWLRDRGKELRHVYHAYSVGDLVTDSTFAIRAAYGWHRLQRDGEIPRLYGFVVADVAANVDELATALLALRGPASGTAH
jgi:exosortase/archaeosortase family protein